MSCCWSACWPTVTSCSRACPAWARRCWCAPSRRPLLKFKRIQFTPDLMPGDVLGTNVFNPSAASSTFMRGPIFTAAAARRRDQPHAAEDPVRAAGGDAGAHRDDRRRRRTTSATRSSSSPRRTRSSSKAPTRCPRRSSIASCSSCDVRHPEPRREARSIVTPARLRRDAALDRIRHRAACRRSTS